MEAVMVILALACVGATGLIAYFIAQAVRVGTRGQWEAEADAVIARSHAAYHEVRRAINEGPRDLRQSLSSALKQGDRLLRRLEELKKAGMRITRGLQSSSIIRVQREIQHFYAQESRTRDARLREDYANARRALERQIAHYNALRTKLLEILANMREIQSVVEGMYPRVVRLTLHGVDVSPEIELRDDTSVGVLEEMDIYIEELEKMDASSDLLDIAAIERDIEYETRRRIESGELEFDPALVPPSEESQRH